MTVPEEFYAASRFQGEAGESGILADAIDPATGDYLSLERGFDPTDAAVLTALERVRGSGSAVIDTGQRFRDKTHVDNNLAVFVQLEAERALQRLIAAGDIKLRPVVVNDTNDSATIIIVYENLRRKAVRRLPLPARALVGI